MSSKDYIIIADILAKVRPEHLSRTDPQWDMWHAIRADLATAMGRENPRFDAMKFCAATDKPVHTAASAFRALTN